MNDARQSTPTVTVIIEGYNETQDLGDANNTMEALRQQDFPTEQVEIILLGNASQAERWNGRYRGDSQFWRVQAIHAPGLSYLQLKNRGADLASADILAFTDSDVWPHPTWLRSIVETIRAGGDVSIGLSMFKSARSWEWDRATRLAAASITWGWVVGKDHDPATQQTLAVGFMDHNFGIRRETFLRHRYSDEFGRLCGAPLLTRSLLDGGCRLVVHPRQRVTHSFSWWYWMSGLHFRYGYEVYVLRRLNDRYPNRWIARTRVFEPLVTLFWHVALDVPRWWRVSRLLEMSITRRLTILPTVIALSCVAHTMELLGMYATMVAPAAMRRWAESV